MHTPLLVRGAYPLLQSPPCLLITISSSQVRVRPRPLRLRLGRYAYTSSTPDSRPHTSSNRFRGRVRALARARTLVAAWRGGSGAKDDRVAGGCAKSSFLSSFSLCCFLWYWRLLPRCPRRRHITHIHTPNSVIRDISHPAHL